MREQGCCRTYGEMRLATKDHIEHIEHDGKVDWGEEAAHRGRFALPCGGIRCKRGKRMEEGGSPGRFALPWGMPVAGRDERPRSSAVGAWTAASAWI